MTRTERFTLIAAILGSGIVMLDGSVVNIALPTIARGLHGDYSSLQWIVDGYLLTLSALMLMAGSLGDIYGQKRIFELGVAGFGITSVLCGLADSTLMLTIGRLLQGVFGALLVPSSLAVINTTFAPEKRGKAIGSWTAYGGIFVALGPLIGGLLIGLSWRYIFLLNVPLAAVCLYIIRQCVQDPHVADTSRKIDYLGGTLATVGLGATTYGLIEGPSSGWSLVPLVALAGGLVALAAFVVCEFYSERPMLPLSLFKSRNFTAANLSTLGMYAALSGALFSITIYLQSAVGYTPLESGLAFIPITIMMFFLAGRMGALSSKYGPRFFMSVGPIVAGLGFFMMLRITPSHANYFLYVLPGVLIFGAGLVLTVAPLTNTVMASVGRDRSGIASAVNNAVSRLAGLLIVAFLGVVVAAQTSQAIAAANPPLTANSKSVVHQSIAGGIQPKSLAKVSQDQRSAVKSTIITSQRSSFIQSVNLNAILAIMAGVISLLMVQNPKPSTSKIKATT